MKQVKKVDPAGYILRYLLSITIVLVATHLILQHINLNLLHEEYGPFYELTNRFDLDDEVSVPTWFSQIVLLLISGTAALAAKLTSKKTKRRLWILVALAGLFASIDEGAGLHELILQSTHNLFFIDQAPTLFANAWWIVLPIIALACIWFLQIVRKELNKQTLVLFAIGLAVYVSGAAIIDLLFNAQIESLFIKQGVLVAIEEGMELVGASIIVYTIVNYLQIEHALQIQNAWHKLKP